MCPPPISLTAPAGRRTDYGAEPDQAPATTPWQKDPTRLSWSYVRHSEVQRLDILPRVRPRAPHIGQS